MDDIVNKYNNKYHKTIKMKPVVNPSMYIDFNKENNKEGPKFKVGDNVRISKYENIFANGYFPNWSEEIFVIKNVKYTVPWICDLNGLLVILKEKKLLEPFTKKNCEKQIQKSLKLTK